MSIPVLHFIKSVRCKQIYHYFPQWSFVPYTLLGQVLNQRICYQVLPRYIARSTIPSSAHVQILPYACQVYLDCMIFCSQGTLHLRNPQISSKIQKESVPWLKNLRQSRNVMRMKDNLEWAVARAEGVTFLNVACCEAFLQPAGTLIWCSVVECLRKSRKGLTTKTLHHTRTARCLWRGRVSEAHM